MKKNPLSSKNYVFTLLARREHSCLEIKQKLSKKGIELTEIEDLIAEFISKDWLSNSRFAEVYVRSRANKGYGSIKIRYELIGKGIANEIIDAELAKFDWQVIAEKICAKKFKVTAEDNLIILKKRKFLYSRGFIV